jgi:REP element-mobilizing transposase RayT
LALALQGLTKDPEAVITELRYHLVWNTAGRAPVLTGIKGGFDAVQESFLGASDWTRGAAALMCLAPDHVHVYVESDGTRSIEAIVGQLKRRAGDALRLVSEADPTAPGLPSELWDEAYFSETIG